MKVRQYDSIVFFTGAGISAESGVPTYRGAGGIWEQYDWQSVACQSAFMTHPEKVLDFHEYRRSLVSSCKPNMAHTTIAQAQSYSKVHIITQNIDGLHQKAGSHSVIELHGSLWRLRCEKCDKKVTDLDEKYQTRMCACGNRFRPDITWFNDPINISVFEEARELILSCDLFLSIGTSASVWPAAGLPMVAFDTSSHTVEINLEKTELSHHFSENYFGKAGDILPDLIEFQ